MQRTDFHFELPKELIAQYPAEQRDASRLLCIDNLAALHDKHFADLADLLNPGDLLVLNNTRVIPARLFGQKPTGGKVEILLERIIDTKTFTAQIRSNKAVRVGNIVEFKNNVQLKVLSRQHEMFTLSIVDDLPLMTLLQQQGHIPLPPYISRPDVADDRQRYQTVYASLPGAVAAPTAGLHFTTELLQILQQKGIHVAYVTLHVGAGTYQPVRVDDITQHTMHKEWFSVSADVCEQIKQTKANKGRVIAVGTTSVRCLETAASSGNLTAVTGDTDIFIYPGYKFKVIDGLVTNFHLPESSLLMLVSALAGVEQIKQAYQHAIQERYRFFSYGDAMLIKNYGL